MYTAAALLDMHERAHRRFQKLLDHCSGFSAEELHREIPGFGIPSLQNQLHHAIEAENYWIGVALGEAFEEDDPNDYPTIEALRSRRSEVAAKTNKYLAEASEEELNTKRRMKLWTDIEEDLLPAHVFLRTVTHLYHHQGQALVICRILGRPGPDRMDFPLKDD